jgi:hypothetical protein
LQQSPYILNELYGRGGNPRVKVRVITFPADEVFLNAANLENLRRTILLANTGKFQFLFTDFHVLTLPKLCYRRLYFTLSNAHIVTGQQKVQKSEVKQNSKLEVKVK